MAKIISIAWGIIVNLAETAVALAMLHIAKSPFENIVVSALVLIYLAITGSFAILGLSLYQKGNQDMARFIELAKSLRLNTELDEEALGEDREKLNKVQTRFWIGAIFRMLLAFLAGANLVITVVS